MVLHNLFSMPAHWAANAGVAHLMCHVCVQSTRGDSGHTLLFPAAHPEQ